MAYAEVHQGTKPALRGRPTAASALLLLVMVLLAGNMSWTRANDPLAPTITPQRFGASFRPPKHFDRFEPSVPSSTLFVHFQKQSTEGPMVRLTYWRFEPDPKINATALAENLLGHDDDHARGNTNAIITAISPGTNIKTPKELGSQTGVEIADPRGSTLARAVILENGLGYAVTIDVEGEPISESLYELFDLSCQSLQFIHKPPA